MPAGNIARKQAHAPRAQKMLISFEERRLIILIISGMFQRGRIMLAIKAILVNITEIASSACGGLAMTCTGFILCLACAAEDVFVFMLVHLDKLVPRRPEVFTRVKLFGADREHLSYFRCHGEPAV